jgi:hypothetical protein
MPSSETTEDAPPPETSKEVILPPSEKSADEEEERPTAATALKPTLDADISRVRKDSAGLAPDKDSSPAVTAANKKRSFIGRRSSNGLMLKLGFGGSAPMASLGPEEDEEEQHSVKQVNKSDLSDAVFATPPSRALGLGLVVESGPSLALQHADAPVEVPPPEKKPSDLPPMAPVGASHSRFGTSAKLLSKFGRKGSADPSAAAVAMFVLPSPSPVVMERVFTEEDKQWVAKETSKGLKYFSNKGTGLVQLEKPDFLKSKDEWLAEQKGGDEFWVAHPGLVWYVLLVFWFLSLTNPIYTPTPFNCRHL